MPFAVAERDGVLTLTLDTPGSPINIFNHATAHQLIDILAGVNPATTRAIVFETAKPNSFINGVGLLLAHASQTYDDIERASTAPWTAYRAVREAPVPTIAVVQGSCFGCGVEFALNCDYRIASDDAETQFYMTELNDYLFIPLFGSTWNLPDAVGLSAAIDLLLWGERWQAPKARSGGLIDEVIPHPELHERKQRFVDQVLRGAQPTRRRGRVAWGTSEDAVMDRARRRVQSLPPQYHKVYTDALDLLEAGARQSGTYVEHQQRELRCSADSALSTIGKSAYAFFYLRQMASERAAGRLRGDAPAVTLCVEAEGDSAAAALDADLRNRNLAGVRFAGREAADFRFVAATDAGTTRAARRLDRRDVAVHMSFAAGPSNDGAGAALYMPAYRFGGRLIELAIRGDDSAVLAKEEAGRLTRTLQRFGFEVARTAPQDTFVSNMLLLAYLSPLLTYIQQYGDTDVVNATLREAGFVRRPHDLLPSIGGAALAAQLATRMQRTSGEIEAPLAALGSPDRAEAADAGLIDALCISLLDAVLVARERGDVRDLPTVDLIARELLDFPRHLCSLCTWLKRERIASAVERDPRIGSLVTESALTHARAFAAEGRELYR